MKKKKTLGNYCFIDGQNLHLGTSTEGWVTDPFKLRVYLKDKYKIAKAYYFLGYVKDENNTLYTRLQEAGFIVVFKKQMIEMTSKKKGNIDSDMIFYIMEKLIEEGDKFHKMVLVSGDGDFKIVVDYLLKKDRLLKILFPNKKYASSMYRGMQNSTFDYLKNSRSKVEYYKPIKHKKREVS